MLAAIIVLQCTVLLWMVCVQYWMCSQVRINKLMGTLFDLANQRLDKLEGKEIQKMIEKHGVKE